MTNHCSCGNTGVVDTAGAAVGGIDGDGNPIDMSAYATNVSVDAKIAGLVNGSPASLNTLGELAAAINNNPQFGADVLAQLGQHNTRIASLEGAPDVDLSGYATQTYVQQRIAQVIDAAPEALNTLNELAAALGDNPDFAAQVVARLAALEAAPALTVADTDYVAVFNAALE